MHLVSTIYPEKSRDERDKDEKSVEEMHDSVNMQSRSAQDLLDDNDNEDMFKQNDHILRDTKMKKCMEPKELELHALKQADIEERMDDDDNKDIEDMYNPGPSTEGDVDETHDDEVRKWLRETVDLPQYYDLFINNGLISLELISKIETLHNLHYIGITKKGHQIVIMNCIEKLKDPIDDHLNIEEDETPYL